MNTITCFSTLMKSLAYLEILNQNYMQLVFINEFFKQSLETHSITFSKKHIYMDAKKIKLLCFFII